VAYKYGKELPLVEPHVAIPHFDHADHAFKELAVFIMTVSEMTTFQMMTAGLANDVPVSTHYDLQTIYGLADGVKVMVYGVEHVLRVHARASFQQDDHTQVAC
jgi:hypothetical protein